MICKTQRTKVQAKAEEKAKGKNLNPLIFFLASPLPSPKP